MQRTQASNDPDDDDDDGRPLLFSHDDPQPTDRDAPPSSTLKSIFVRPLGAIAQALSKTSGKTDYTAELSEMKKWRDPESEYAPVRSQVGHALYTHLGLYWPTTPTQKDTRMHIRTLIRALEPDHHRSPLEKELNDLMKHKSRWDQEKYEDISLRDRRDRMTENFTDKEANVAPITAFIDKVTARIQRLDEDPNPISEEGYQNRSSQETLSPSESRVDGWPEGLRNSDL